MIKIPKMSRRDLVLKFGIPEKGREKEFSEHMRSHLVEIDLPYSMNGGKVKRIICNKLIAEPLIGALKEINSIFCGEDKISGFGIDQYHGCGNVREVSGWPGWWSIHSYWCAIDLNKHIGRMGHPSLMPAQFVEAFEKRGFHWGGRFDRPDGMHFSCIFG